MEVAVASLWWDFLSISDMFHVTTYLGPLHYFLSFKSTISKSADLLSARSERQRHLKKKKTEVAFDMHLLCVGQGLVLFTLFY